MNGKHILERVTVTVLVVTCITALLLVACAGENGSSSEEIPDGTGAEQFYSGPIVNAPGAQLFMRVAADGGGGALVTWQDRRDAATGADIYVQKVDAFGRPVWNDNGVAVCNAVGDQINPVIASDGSGGAFVAWVDNRAGVFNEYDLYLQRVGSDGAPLWTVNGLGIVNSTIAGSQWAGTLDLVSDGSGGVILVWRDSRNGYSVGYQVYAQRIDGDGNLLWTDGGVLVSISQQNVFYMKAISDEAGGAIILFDGWVGALDTGLYAQRLDAGGSALWNSSAVAIVNAPGQQNLPETDALIPDGEGGALVLWIDERLGDPDYSDFYIQRVNADGNTLWADNGVAVCTACLPNYNWYLSGAVNDAGEAYVSWAERGLASDWDLDVYMQKFSASGVKQWAAGGLEVFNFDNQSYLCDTAVDSNGDIIVNVADLRNYSAEHPYLDIYAQKIDGNGDVLWTPGGLGISTENWNHWGGFLFPASGGNVFMIQVIAPDEPTLGDDIYLTTIFPDGSVAE